MKQSKKVVALLIAFVMVLGLVPAMAATYTDVTAADKEAVEVLSSFKILQGYPDGTFGGDKTITRAEFAAVACRLIGAEDLSKVQVDTVFPDVAQAHWASGYVQMAQQQGIIKGFPDGNFQPETTITYEQAVKMLVCALGYEPMASETGYPTGYLYAGAQAGITNGVGGTIGQDASRSMVAKLSYKALSANMMERKSFGTGDKEYVVTDETVLSKYLDAAKIKGTVKVTPISGGTKDKVEILVSDDFKSTIFKKATSGNNSFYIGSSNAAQMLGQKVIAFISVPKNSNTNPTIITIQVDPSQGEGKTLDVTNLKSFSSSDKKVTFYTDRYNQKTSTFTLNSFGSDQVYLNGVEASSTINTFAKLQALKNATVTFAKVDEATTQNYDTIYITQYYSVLVESVNTSTKTIKLQSADDAPYASTPSGNAIIKYFDPNKTDYSVTLVDEAGVTVDPATLVKGDVITYTYAEDTNSKHYYNGVVASSTIEGEIEDFTMYLEDFAGSRDMIAYIINGTEYITVDDAHVLSLNTEGTFTLDANGKIVDIDKNTSNKGEYVVYAASNDNASGSDLIIYGDNGEQTLTMASKVRIDGAKAVSPSNVRSTLGDADQIITYKTDANGNVIEVYTVGGELESANDTTDMTYVADDKVVKYTDADSAAQEAKIDDTTKVFVKTSNDEFAMIDLTTLEDDQKLEGDDTVIVDVDEDTEVAAAVFIDYNKIMADSKAEIVLLTSVADDYKNTNGDKVARYTYYDQDGNKKTAYGTENYAAGITAMGTSVGTGSMFKTVILIFGSNGEVLNVLAVSTANLAGLDGTNATPAGFAAAANKDTGAFYTEDVYYVAGTIAAGSKSTTMEFTPAVAKANMAITATIPAEFKFSTLTTGGVLVYDADENTYTVETSTDFIEDSATTVNAICKVVDGKVQQAIVYYAE